MTLWEETLHINYSGLTGHWALSVNMTVYLEDGLDMADRWAMILGGTAWLPLRSSGQSSSSQCAGLESIDTGQFPFLEVVALKLDS